MGLESALELIESVSEDSVLFAGETIIDIYTHVSPLGRPSKEVVLSVQKLKDESFYGGIVAAADCAKAFVGNVEVWSNRKITKRRFLDTSHTRKLFQVYEENESLEEPAPIDLPDVVAVIDYGHGMFGTEEIAYLSGEASFLAVNVQSNSGNFGFNLATKYENVDYLVVDEMEARLATQNQFGPIEQSLEELSAYAERVIITLGRDGAIGCSPNTDILKVPAFKGNVVDTIGSGDAFFAVTAPMANLGDLKDLMMIGNAAGKLKSCTVGHRETVTKDALISFLKANA